MAKTESVEIQMAEILDEYSERVRKVAEQAAEQAAKDTSKTLKNTSPKRYGEYARSWTVKKDADGGYIVHNSKHYQLTHLLENGHVIRNKKGTYGRTSGIKHIQPAEQEGIQNFESRIERGLA